VQPSAAKGRCDLLIGSLTIPSLIILILNFINFVPGMREDPNVKKIIYLITDGEQNPKLSPNKQVLDPAVASQSLYDKGIGNPLLLLSAVGIKTAQFFCPRVVTQDWLMLKT